VHEELVVGRLIQAGIWKRESASELIYEDKKGVFGKKRSGRCR